MNIVKKLAPYLVSHADTIRYALEKIESNKHKLIYVVDDKNRLLGSFADGDFRRAAINNQFSDLDEKVTSISNPNCYSLHSDSSDREIKRLLDNGLASVPLVDKVGHVIAIAEKGTRFFTIANRRISDEDPCYVIAEIGNNHQGEISIAKQLVDAAIDAKADCAKFQMRTMADLYGTNNLNRDDNDLGAEYTLDLLSRYQLSDEELFEMFDYCKSYDITPLCTPWDLASLQKLELYDMPAYKVASADFTNYPLLEAISETGKPMFCSTGMSSEDEITQTIEFLDRKRASYILLHCNSTYPTPYKDVELKYLSKLKEKSKTVVGYSGHERGICVPVAAIALGAKVIEKHISLDTAQIGTDHKVSLLPAELKTMVCDIRAVESALGTRTERVISQGEMMNRDVLAKSIVASTDIAKGQIISESDLKIIAPGKGLQPNRLNELLNTYATRDFSPGDFFYDSDIDGTHTKNETYDFDRPYGVPVRFHDFNELTKNINLDFVEFHLSYQDLDLDISKFLPASSKIDFAVHSPELFANDHLLDLAADNATYRKKSIEELQRVVVKTREINGFFDNTKNPILVLNAGGWNTGGFLSESQVVKKYDLVKDSLDKVDLAGVTLGIQTMPPFPWHFGGQSYHNLFVASQQINEFCDVTNHKICLDISHTMMACNYFNWDFYQFLKDIAPHVVHLHIVDAKDDDGEGVKLGEGDVDFVRLGHLLNKHMNDIPFIPEIWQGHKNDGEGFWQALTYLETRFSQLGN